MSVLHIHFSFVWKPIVYITGRSSLVFLARLAADLILCVALPSRLFDRVLAPRRRVPEHAVRIGALVLITCTSVAAGVSEVGVVAMGALS
jgi:hypothetical protein